MFMFFPPVIQTTGNFDASVTCENNSLTVFITKDDMVGVLAEELKLSGDSCFGEDFNDTHFRVSTGFDQCETVAEVRNIIVIRFEITQKTVATH